MAKVIVAFPDAETSRKIGEALETGGYEVFRTCTTGSEVMRAFNQCQDGVLVCGVRFQDRTADALAWDLGRQAVILVVGKPGQLENCEHPDLFKRPIPCSQTELISAVDMLLQLHDHRMPRRSAEQDEPVRAAKQLLMDARGLTEPEAHRALQRYSMKCGLRMQACAAMLLDHTLSPDQVLMK